MAKSIKQLQAELLASGALDRLGAAKGSFGAINELPLLEQFLILSAANFIERVRQNIEVLGISDTGALSDDITSGSLTKTGTGYSIELGYPRESPAAKYYDFVNKGVKGIQSGTPNSKYAFRTLGVGKGMALNILKWVRRNNVKSDVAITKRQAKRQSLSKMVDEASKKKSLAYAVAVNIKKRGLKKTGFFDNAVNAYFGGELSVAVSKIVGKDISILIKNYGNNNQ